MGYPTFETEIDEKFYDTNHSRVLIVDDNSTNRTILALMCDKFGIECDFAKNGRQCLEILRGETFAFENPDCDEHVSHKTNDYMCIIMDFHMPELYGSDTTREIVELEKKNAIPRTPVVGHTASSSEEEIEQFLLSGIEDFLPKPPTMKHFEEKIMKFKDSYAM
eukprot:CAMPEP_0115008778 /NCGR_PEP_ID=MMETSP0216-20121206/22154_1 /TAXON_ID=223996 /ORGANISM="Protocruzia adherens, Strain Boccale" /LENGTH=163 /DNA_ID=CAMNT_0002376329 /DNA_START=2856 /DNA_END=3347 /DNA_ORIENTATION=-